MEELDENMHSPELETVYETLEQVQSRYADSGIDLKRAAGSSGLTMEQVQVLLERDGYNVLTPPEQESQWIMLIRQFRDPFMILLGVAGILSCIAFGIDPSQTLNIVLGGVLFCVVIFTCLMSWSQERKTIKTMRGFLNYLPSTAVAIRDGRKQDVEARSLVVGDIVVLTLGQKVPADVRLLTCSNLKVENGAITGESEPVELEASEVCQKGVTPVEEAKNIALSGSLILDGSGIGVVLATGDRSLIGRIASLTTQTENRQSTMEIEVSRFVRFIAVLAISMAVIFFVIEVGRRRGDGALQSFINGFLVIIVANVPQGLPTTVTSLQLIVAKRLATQKVFVKRLDAVETLGAITLICSDKTGTLTMNKMTVVDGWVNCEIGLHYFSEALFAGEMRASSSAVTGVEVIEKVGERAMPSVQMIQIIACVCNNAVAAIQQDHMKEMVDENTTDDEDLDVTLRELKNEGHKKHDTSVALFTGNPSECALLSFFEGFRPGTVAQLRAVYPVQFQIPFNSANKYHVVVVRGSFREPQTQPGKGDVVYTVLMKGAPEVLSKHCDKYMKNGQVLPVDQEFMESSMEAYPYFARRGQRVLGFCMTEMVLDENTELSSKNIAIDNMTYVGMLAIMDPPRDDVPGAIVKCRGKKQLKNSLHSSLSDIYIF